MYIYLFKIDFRLINLHFNYFETSQCNMQKNAIKSHHNIFIKKIIFKNLILLYIIFKLIYKIQQNRMWDN